jgi:hypothetical protein
VPPSEIPKGSDRSQVAQLAGWSLAALSARNVPPRARPQRRRRTATAARGRRGDHRRVHSRIQCQCPGGERPAVHPPARRRRAYVGVDHRCRDVAAGLVRRQGPLRP